MSNDNVKSTSGSEILSEEAPPYTPLEGKTVLLGITGGIAAYKAADYSKKIRALGARVIPVMTKHATEFVSPITFAALTGEKVYTDLFCVEGVETIPHIELARSADLFLVLPATANIIGKAANGLADDFLSTLLLAFSGPVLFSPSMNPAMYAHPATQANAERLKTLGYRVIEPEVGETACGDRGRGRLPEWSVVREAILKAATPQTLRGMNVLVSAGPTREYLDPVRYISNCSSGVMGYAMSMVAFRRGARVTLVSGPVSIPYPPGIEFCPVETAGEMEDIIIGKLSQDAHVIIMTAAVADYTPAARADQKIKKDTPELRLDLVRTNDILSQVVKSRKGKQIIVGFCAETQDLKAQVLKKIRLKGADLLIANDVSQPDAGFDVPNNRVLIVSADGDVDALPLLHKEEVGEKVWDRIQDLLPQDNY
ncbi:MAG: bifunctional phosphopantothenoylcysteine decarboxylase/phosphopantothenate--cysteine ligase CoaBC [Thermodesulfobacteriota bacterium]|nr:bifunctional phosphopantothenoylcysteine decarboxylase/phosphopantothenate--cysteine ligase CoaBC [Thermodesulfobacteriota bacterium]